MNFLIEYRRSTGDVRLEQLGDEQAMTRRHELEMLHRNDPDMEVVVLRASSLDDVKRTHARYFKTADELTAELIEMLA